METEENRRKENSRMAGKKFLDLDGLTDYNKKLNEKLDGKFVPKQEGKGLSQNDFTDEYKKLIDDLAYVPIVISAFTNSVNTVEMGGTVDEVTLNWSLNKEPESQKVDSTAVDKVLRTLTLTEQDITADKTFTLSATDERNKTVTKTTSIYFRNGVYWGVGANTEAFDSTFVLTLTKGLQATKAKTFTVNAGAGQHIYYAVPTRYGACAFNVGGFDGGFGKAVTIEFTNESGYTESYDIYKSDNTGLGSTTVKAS